MRAFASALLLLIVSLGADAQRVSLARLSGAAREDCQKGDAGSLLVYRDGLRELVDYADTRRDLFPATAQKEPLPLTPEQRAEVRAIWRSVLDYQLALESIRAFHADFHKLSRAEERSSFLVMYAAFLAEYRNALELIERADRNPGYQVLLNDAVPDLGVDAGTWSRFKFRFLNVAIASEFAAFDAIRHFYDGGDTGLLTAIDEDRTAIYEAGKGAGPLLTAKNALQVVKETGGASWLPVQTGVASWMGDTRVYREGVALISKELIGSIQPLLRPGDVMFERREWYLSNIGLPGYWTHVALYVGTADERRAMFDDPATKEWVKSQGETSGDLERLLAARYPEAWKLSGTREHGDPRRVVEAIGEGVSFTSLEHSAAADALGVLRPRLTVRERAIAIARAFGYAGRPYDFEFDFVSDDELVCSELVFKAYEPGEGMGGLALEMHELAGRRIVPPNEIVRQWSREAARGRPQFDFVLFLDGSERSRAATRTTEAALRESWARPKWHIVTTASSK
ncbi:MAG: protein tyrosine phosphatase [Thermoanaerobaculia bacterium]|nr:protein tyrosine phosphatase [Thermoanaerobaculia bacterium]